MHLALRKAAVLKGRFRNWRVQFILLLCHSRAPRPWNFSYLNPWLVLAYGVPNEHYSFYSGKRQDVHRELFESISRTTNPHSCLRGALQGLLAFIHLFTHSAFTEHLLQPWYAQSLLWDCSESSGGDRYLDESWRYSVESCEVVRNYVLQWWAEDSNGQGVFQETEGWETMKDDSESSGWRLCKEDSREAAHPVQKHKETCDLCKNMKGDGAEGGRSHQPGL